MIVIEFGIAACVVFVSAWLTRSLSSPQSRIYYLDRPNSRSLHVRPTPRTGGLAIFGSFAVGLSLFVLQVSFVGWSRDIYTMVGILGGLLLIAIGSFLDDRANLSLQVRLATHVVISSAVVIIGQLALHVVVIPGIGSLPLNWMATPITILFLVWMVNLYNFMDGMDGFAGGVAVIGFGFLSYLGWSGHNRSVGMISLLAAAAASGFLTYNLPPAKIFMGDVGSTVLGFLAGAMTLIGTRNGLFDYWVPVLIFSPFIVDSTVTILKRLLNGEVIWRPHRKHYYQRLVLAGWSHRKTVLAEYCLMIACGLSAISYTKVGPTYRLSILLVWMFAYIVLAVAVRLVEQTRSTAGNLDANAHTVR